MIPLQFAASNAGFELPEVQAHLSQVIPASSLQADLTDSQFCLLLSLSLLMHYIKPDKAYQAVRVLANSEVDPTKTTIYLINRRFFVVGQEYLIFDLAQDMLMSSAQKEEFRPLLVEAHSVNLEAFLSLCQQKLDRDAASHSAALPSRSQ